MAKQSFAELGVSSVSPPLSPAKASPRRSRSSAS